MHLYLWGKQIMDRIPHPLDAFCDPWTFPRTKQVSTGHLFTHTSFRPSFQVPLTKSKRKRISFRISVSFWCARRDLNSRFPEYMELLKLLFVQNARLASNIPIFPTDTFILILLRVLVRVKMVCLFSLAKQSHKIPPFPTSTFYHRT